ncbi:zinc finger protein 184 [Salarias fasciatus]|uniref:zinc finger protein 184 n=1 Tax=Salarias fasciatus TaxID=181472 RepID=UPI001176E0E6|nr:zinc finger protein 184-like [Salarias fasciatus]
MKARELKQPASRAHPTGNQVSSGTVGGENGVRHTSSRVGVGEKSPEPSESVCRFTRNSRGKARDLSRRPGRPRKAKQLTKGKTDPDTDECAAVRRQDVSTTLPLPTSLDNHNTDELPDAIDNNLIDNSLHGRDSHPHAVSAERVESVDSLAPKRRRGRPKKRDSPAFQNTASESVVSVSAASPTNANNVDVPTRRLRSNQLPSTQGENSASHSNAHPQQLASKQSNRKSKFQAVKRRRQRSQVNDQVPEKMLKLDNSQEAESLSFNNTDCTVTAKANQQKGPDDDRPEGDANGENVQLFAQAGEERERQSNEHASPQRMLPSQPKPAATSSESLSNLKTVSSSLPVQAHKNTSEKITGSKDSQSETPDDSESPLDVDLQTATVSNPGATPTSVEAQKPADMLLEPKEEDVEIDVDSLNPASQLRSHKSVQNRANPTVQAENLPDQRSYFRRKRGGKRRRRITVHNVVLAKEDREASQESKWEGEQKEELDVGEENVGNQVNIDANAKVIYIKKGGKTLLKCGYCGRIFKFQSQFVIHQRIHTGERPYKCHECGKGFSKNSNLNLHLKTHRKNNIYQKCPFCSIKFSCLEYASHIEMHAQEFVQEYKIDNPEKPNSGADREDCQELEKMQETQEKKERKLCQYCGKSFQFQSALVRHVRVHTGEKPYKCDICGKAFGQAYFLRVHELTHWSVKRYNCTRCEKSFTHYSNAKNHTCRPVGGEDEIHPNRCLKPSLTYTCHICKNVFDRLQEFNCHMRDHTGAKLYRCLYCDKLFGVQSEFTAHHNVCKAERPNAGIKQEATMSLIQYTVPALRCSVGNNSAPVTAANCETQKKQSQTSRKRRLSDTNKPFQSTVIRAHPLSHLVSKLNKLDTRSDPRKYLCPACGRLFRHMGRLRAHMLTHSHSQSYTCACCGKTLGNWKKLWHHQRVHRQRRGRFSCPRCGQGFRFVEPYRKHMREHPEFEWVGVRPKNVSRPYQCELCRCGFETLDLLFGHELGHASPQEVCRDSDFELSLEDHSTQPSKKALSLPTSSATLMFHTAQEQKSSAVSSSAQHPAAAAQQPPAALIVQSQRVSLTDSPGHPSRSHSAQGPESSQDRTNEHTPVMPLRTLKKSFIENASKSKEGFSDDVQCAVCGNSYCAISDLYQHYLQHARGQV